MIEQGTLTPISALFPSTTAASVSTLHLGVLPAEHALYEWNIYIPAYGEVIQSLAFSPLGLRTAGRLPAEGLRSRRRLLEVHETVHQRLARHGVRSLQFANRAYASSAYNRIISAGAEVIRHGTLAEGLVQLKEALLATPGKAHLGFYWAAIDTIAHLHGPGTPYHAAEIASFWHTFDAVFRNVKSPDTLYLFTADHGHVGATTKRDDLRQRDASRNWPTASHQPDRQPDLAQRLSARRVPARAARAPAAGLAAAAPPPRRHRACHAGRRSPGSTACSARGGQPGAAPPARRYPGPSLSRPLHLVARAGRDGEHTSTATTAASRPRR